MLEKEQDLIQEKFQDLLHVITGNHRNYLQYVQNALEREEMGVVIELAHTVQELMQVQSSLEDLYLHWRKLTNRDTEPKSNKVGYTAISVQTPTSIMPSTVVDADVVNMSGQVALERCIAAIYHFQSRQPEPIFPTPLMVWEYVKEHYTISSYDLRQVMAYDRRTAGEKKLQIAKMKNKNFIDSIGQKNSTRWKLTAAGVLYAEELLTKPT